MKIKSILRNLRIKLGKRILDKKTPLASITFPPKSILFLRHDGKIGDYVVSSFIFREIKKQSPQTKIGVVCSKKNAYLFKQNPYIDELYFVKTKDIKDYLRCAKQLAQEQYEILIDPTVTLRNRDLLFLRAIKAKNYIGYQKEDYQLFNFSIPAQAIHFSEIYKQALELVGFKQISTTYDVPFTEKAKQDIQDFLVKNNLSSYVAVNFFGAGSARRFNDIAIKSLLDNLTSNTMNIVLLTFPEVTEKLKMISNEYHNVFIYEKTETVFDTIELIRNAKCVISPDTAIVHIASGFNKPLIAFYSQDEENFNHWQPNNSASTHILRFNKSVNELDFSQIKPEWLK
ncbi:glycosyltransferase family 9 protein [Haemophilus parahaemolyticus]|uniref:glycosyltransferase family 9 protein n=1 Tax=Haemophilus parahaemolyticus TaxID=735 RepID=UPI0028E4C1D5|nr:glycosyltransferase family 9 protein [Haemophilus parahaemolyticus]